MTEAIRLFVGCAPDGADAESQMVLEYSVRKVSSLPVEITWMQLTRDRASLWYSGGPGGWNTEGWATPFSGFRWGIPEACGYQGRALYTDSDVVFLQDPKELWEMNLKGAVAAVKSPGRFCVTVWDNARFGQLVEHKKLPVVSRQRQYSSFHASMQQFFGQRPDLLLKFDRRWNNFDGENDPLDEIKILHLTDMSTQPNARLAMRRLALQGERYWYDGPVHEHRRRDVVELFDRFYADALAADYTVEQYLPSQKFGEYKKQSQAGYASANGFDVTRRQ